MEEFIYKRNQTEIERGTENRSQPTIEKASGEETDGKPEIDGDHSLQKIRYTRGKIKKSRFPGNARVPDYAPVIPKGVFFFIAFIV